MDCAHTRELLEQYVLGALEPEERSEVERHLESCAECRALAAASALQPPAALRERVLAAAAPSGRRPRPVRRRTLAVALAAAVPALALGWAAGFQQASARENDRRDELARQLGVEALVFEVVDSRETDKAFLRTTRERGPFARSYGKLYTRPDLSDVVAFANRLPEAPKGRAYHLWLTVGGRTKLAGVLTVRDGFGLVVFKAQRPGPKYGAAVLTLQKPGADAPAGTPVLTWRA